MKTSRGRSFKDLKGTIFVFIIIVSWVTITPPPLKEGDWSGTRTRCFCSLAELLQMKRKLFSGRIWRGAALIERLNFQSSRRYAHKHARMQNAKWGRGTKRSPRQARGHRKYRQKREAGIMWGLEETVVAILDLLYGKEKQHLHTFIHLVQSKMLKDVYLGLSCH